MKIRLLLAFTLLTAQLNAGINCINNTENLENQYDTKEWHSADCDCDCKNIRKSICVDCGHLQNAQPWTIVQTSQSKMAQNNTTQTTPTIQETLKHLIALKNKQLVQ